MAISTNARQNKLGVQFAFGLVVAFFGTATMLASHFLPWITMTGALAGSTRSELYGAGFVVSEYLHAAFTWPLMAGFALVVLGFWLVLNEMLALPRHKSRFYRVTLIAAIFFASSVLAVASARIFGLAISDALDAGPRSFSLHVVPLINSDVAIFLAVWGALLLRGELRAAKKSTRAPFKNGSAKPFLIAGLALGALLAAAMLPYAAQEAAPGQPRDYYGESDLAAIHQGVAPEGTALQETAKSVSIIRGLMWAILAVSLVAGICLINAQTAWAPMAWAGAAQGYQIMGIPILVGLVMSVLLYSKISAAPGFSPSVNFLAVPAFLLMLGEYVGFVKGVTIPFVKHQIRHAGRATEAEHNAPTMPGRRLVLVEVDDDAAMEFTEADLVPTR